MAPKIVNKAQRKKEIARVALDLFAEKGFESVSIGQIAEAAQMGKGTVYEYFESKEELILNAIMAWFEQIGQGAENILMEIADPVERLRGYVKTTTEAFMSDERMLKVFLSIFQMVLTNEEIFREHNFVSESFQGMRKTLVDILLDGVAQGVFRSEIAKDAEKIAINLMAYLDGIGAHYLMSRNYFDLMEQVDFYLDRLIQTLEPASAMSNEQ